MISSETPFRQYTEDPRENRPFFCVPPFGVSLSIRLLECFRSIHGRSTARGLFPSSVVVELVVLRIINLTFNESFQFPLSTEVFAAKTNTNFPPTPPRFLNSATLCGLMFPIWLPICHSSLDQVFRKFPPGTPLSPMRAPLDGLCMLFARVLQIL